MTLSFAPARISTVVIATPHALVSVALRVMLTEEADAVTQRLRLLPPDTDDHPDVVLYDVFALLEGDGSDLDHWVKQTASTVVALTRPLRPDLGTLALERGAEAAAAPQRDGRRDPRAWWSSALAGTLAEQNGRGVRPPPPQLGERPPALSPRETRRAPPGGQLGLSNHEIAQELYRQHQLGEDLHPQRLPQGRRDHAAPGRLVVRPPRASRHRATEERQYGWAA